MLPEPMQISEKPSTTLPEILPPLEDNPPTIPSRTLLEAFIEETNSTYILSQISAWAPTQTQTLFEHKKVPESWTFLKIKLDIIKLYF